MKIKTLLTHALMAGLLGVSANASAGFSFDSPFDWFDNNDNDYYRYGDRGGRDYGRERWRQYDEWEPNYWRYRFFDDNSQDYVFDGFGDGRGRFDFNMDMNMDMDGNSRYDGYNDYRGRGNYRDYGYSNQNRNYDRAAPAPRAPMQRAPAQRAPQNNNSRDRYNDDYWRDYSQQYNGPRRR